MEKGKIRDGKYEGYSTYFVTLDGEEIGYLPVTQMKYHSGQIPGDSAVMIIHIPNSKTDKEKGRFGAKLQMPYRHAAINLYELKED